MKICHSSEIFEKILKLGKRIRKRILRNYREIYGNTSRRPHLIVYCGLLKICKICKTRGWKVEIDDDLNVYVTDDSVEYQYSRLEWAKERESQKVDSGYLYSPDEIMYHIFQRTVREVVDRLPEFLSENGLSLENIMITPPTASQLMETRKLLDQQPKYEILLKRRNLNDEMIPDVTKSIRENVSMNYNDISKNLHTTLDKMANVKILPEIYDEMLKKECFSKRQTDSLITFEKSENDDKSEVILQLIGRMIRSGHDLGSLLDPCRWYYMIFYPHNEELSQYLKNVGILAEIVDKKVEFVKINDSMTYDDEVIDHQVKNATNVAKFTPLDIQILSHHQDAINKESFVQETRKLNHFKKIQEEINSTRSQKRTEFINNRNLFTWIRDNEYI